MLPEPLSVVKKVAQLLDDLRIPYFIGGSIASSILGFERSTMDVDLVADMKEENVLAFVEAVKSEFYVDADMIREAIQTHTSFNILYLPTMVKVDIFIMQPDAWAKEKWARRRLERIGSGSDEFAVYLASPEDMILQKLAWFQMGSGVSERQWRDVQGVLKVQAPHLDYAYLQHWAMELGLFSLLQKAFADAEIPVSPDKE